MRVSHRLYFCLFFLCFSYFVEQFLVDIFDWDEGNYTTIEYDVYLFDFFFWPGWLALKWAHVNVTDDCRIHIGMALTGVLDARTYRSGRSTTRTRERTHRKKWGRWWRLELSAYVWECPVYVHGGEWQVYGTWKFTSFFFFFSCFFFLFSHVWLFQQEHQEQDDEQLKLT